jgi:hypothetical protein
MKLTMTTMIATGGEPGPDEVLELECPVADNGHPEFASLRPLIKGKLNGAELDHVRVFWHGQYLDMFVDEMGSVNRLPINVKATAIYWNNVRIHDPARYKPDEMPTIHGTAVLFDKKVWY